MELPRQLTKDQLHAEVDRRLERLKENQIPEPQVEVTGVQGARVEDMARGALLVTPNTERVVAMPYFASSVAVTYNGLSKGRSMTSTSSARLLRVGDRWRPNAATGPWEGMHLFSVEREELTLVYHVPDGHKTALMPPQPTPVDTEAHKKSASRTVYEIPPPATEIKGKGVIHYMTGQKVSVDGTRLLKRVGANGELKRRPGGIFADFSADVAYAGPVQVRIGTAWITLQPKEENPRG